MGKKRDSNMWRMAQNSATVTWVTKLMTNKDCSNGITGSRKSSNKEMSTI